MKKINNKSGFSLAEILMALAIFALLAVPAYVMFSYSAAEEKAYHKTAAANKIMESFRDEIKNIGFELVEKEFGPETFKGEDIDINNASNVFPPKTMEIISAEKTKFDPDGAKFNITATKTTKDDITNIQYTIIVKWKQRGSDRSENISFIKVK